MPLSKDHTYAFYRRLIVVPWLKQIEKEQLERDFQARLLQREMPGVFLWAVDGLQRLMKNGWIFTEAGAAERALEEYRLESNSVALWANERTVLDESAAPVMTHALYLDYADYCKRYGYQAVADNHFGRRLKSHFEARIRKADGQVEKAKKGWQGIVLLPEDEPQRPFPSRRYYHNDN
jgi:putative DNA primase/helicase